MVKRIDSLTAAQRAAMEPHADRWIEIGLRTGSADLVKFTDAAQRCYEAARIPWHGNVVRVPSPLVASLAGPVAALVIELHERGISVRGTVDGAIGGEVDVEIRRAIDVALDGVVRGAVDLAVDGTVGLVVDVEVGGAVHGEVHGAIDVEVGGAIDGEIGGAIDGAIRGVVDLAIRVAVDGAIRGAIAGAVDGEIDGAIGGVVAGAVDGAIAGAIRRAIDVAIGGAVSGEINGDDLEAIIRRAVSSVISMSYTRFADGWWRTYWQAWSTYFRDHTALELPDGLWDRSRAFEDATTSAGWWWPHRQFVMVCDSPNEIHREQIGPRGWGSHRMHRDDGPAISWSDGWALWFIHGVRVTQQIVEAPETLIPQQISDEPNAEVRRIMIERFGTDRYIKEIGAKLLDREVLKHENGWDEPIELWRADFKDAEPLVMLHCINGTIEESGERHEFWIRVPPTMNGAVEAASWTYGLDVDAYRKVAART